MLFSSLGGDQIQWSPPPCKYATDGHELLFLIFYQNHIGILYWSGYESKLDK